MPYTSGHKEQTRARILDSARRLFNRNGFTAVSVDEIMAGAGLTRGGFYSYFDSKEELYAEAITRFINPDPVENWKKSALAGRSEGEALARAILDAYLSREHLDDVEGSCPLIGLSTDVARNGGPAKRASQQVVEMMAGIFAANLRPGHATEGGESDREDAQRALALVAMCVGGMVLARAVDEERMADELRAAARQYAITLAGWDKSADN